jgi:hypothetical protein
MRLSVGIARSRTKATELLFISLTFYLLLSEWNDNIKTEPKKCRMEGGVEWSGSGYGPVNGSRENDNDP